MTCRCLFDGREPELADLIPQPAEAAVRRHQAREGLHHVAARAVEAEYDGGAPREFFCLFEKQLVGIFPRAVRRGDDDAQRRMAQQLLRYGARGEGRVFHQHHVGLGEGNFARDVAHEIPEFLGQQVLLAFDVEILVPRNDADFHVRFAEECRQVFGDQALAVPAFGTQDIEHVGLFGRVEIVDRRIADVAGCDLTVLLGEPPLSEIGFAGEGPDDPPLGDALGADFVTQRAVEQFELINSECCLANPYAKHYFLQTEFGCA